MREIFENIGGVFNTDVAELRYKCLHTQMLVFDWDGVFNDGKKGGQYVSGFSESDAMAVNMMRFGIYLLTGKIAFISIITGAENTLAQSWAAKNHFNAVCFRALHKIEAVKMLSDAENISLGRVAFFFDDILDLSVAREVGVRFLINRKASPLFKQYCQKERLCDYITGHSGAENGVRETSELYLSLIDKFEQSIQKRTAYYGDYEDYLRQTRQIKTQKYDFS